MAMPGRGDDTSEATFGYQGSPQDKEMYGNGNHYTTDFRRLDSRIGRWTQPDPVFQPWQSPYNSMDGNPINYNDVRGLSVNKSDYSEHDYNMEEVSKDEAEEEFGKGPRDDGSFYIGTTDGKYYKLTPKSPEEQKADKTYAQHKKQEEAEIQRDYQKAKLKERKRLEADKVKLEYAKRKKEQSNLDEKGAKVRSVIAKGEAKKEAQKRAEAKAKQDAIDAQKKKEYEAQRNEMTISRRIRIFESKLYGHPDNRFMWEGNHNAGGLGSAVDLTDKKVIIGGLLIITTVVTAGTAAEVIVGVGATGWTTSAVVSLSLDGISLVANANTITAYGNNGTTVVVEFLGEDAQTTLDILSFGAGLMSAFRNIDDFAEAMVKSQNVSRETALHIHNVLSLTMTFVD